MSGALACLIEGCANPRVIESAVPAVPPSPAAPPAPAAPPVQAQRSCTAQWLARGHTTQPQAQAFAKKCLNAQGAVEKQLDHKIVTRKVTALINADTPLTALEPSDIATFCPGYMLQDRQGRAVFWRTMIADLVAEESVNNTTAAYWEEDQGQYSIGLLQLSLADEERYRCGFKSEVDVTDPHRNLTCGIKVVTMLVGADGMIGGGKGHEMKGAGAYWQNLRHPSEVRNRLINATRAVAQCRPDPRSS
ncbi:hypothetical protein LHFGNBLO_004798 [Mesorhizobium sp. AR10]|uniref:hypothetical protein n=1 Tax=Mesorhizobium sp. AR10 TaxID=2865839 RepID=UPI002160DC7D|nr:hypothetical protein [Mesorhizobium sp. AR10]UVK37717.1 hypothetical protein LHFGNBLO_004798 [Mesorhizobium sp. AR10]